MTYTEWRDELKQNLLCVSEQERRRVLDYYAEAYADRREAGFSEREIIADFGAPYDAAQRILSERAEENAGDTPRSRRQEGQMPVQNMNAGNPPPNQNAGNYPSPPNYGANNYPPPPNYNGNYAPPPNAQPNNGNANEARQDYTWVFVLLCIIFAIPLFSLIMTMIGITIGFCVAPIMIIGSGAAAIGGSFGVFASGEAGYGFYMLACGIIAIGAGIMLCPVFFKLVKLMWKLFKKFFSWLKSLFSGRSAK